MLWHSSGGAGSPAGVGDATQSCADALLNVNMSLQNVMLTFLPLLGTSWIEAGFFSIDVAVHMLVCQGKKPFQLYVVLSLKAEAFFVCVSAVEESHVTFDLYVLLEVTLC